MSTNLFLTEGGVAGHMSHLYDNRDLTFAKLKEIFNAASSGELEGTEKTDGQNLFISYSVKEGKAKAARNKGNIKAGGMSAEELAEKFAGRGGLTEAFTESFETFEEAVRSLDPETQAQIFGPDTNIYYNAEIMDPRSPNVISYDTKSLVIHRAGHGEFDKETGAKTDRDVSDNAQVLEAALEKMQKATEKKDYTVHVNAIRKLQALSDDTALNTALEALSGLQRGAGVSDEATITEYLIARIAPLVASAVPEANEDTQKKIIGRLMKSGLTFNQVVKGLDKELKEKIRAVIKNEKRILNQAIQPLESVVHDFSVEMLRGLESAFILDNKKEVGRLRDEISSAIKNIEAAGIEDDIEVMIRHMDKLKDVENFATASEGFVFDYDGSTYKFTGNFAPANQILGIAKYGRTSQATTVMKEEITKYDVAIFPGAFKPPHRGHLALVDELANQANKVIILMSEKSRKFVTAEMSQALWGMYLNGRSDVELRVVGGSPVSIAYDFVENPDFDKGKEKITVLAGVGAKGSDAKRFEKSLQGYAREDIVVDVIGDDEMVGMTAITDADGNELSATTMRAAIVEGNIEVFRSYLPDHLQGRAEEIMNSLAPKESIAEMIHRMINEQMNEMSAMGAGAVAGYAGPSKKPKKKKKKRIFREEDDNYSEIEKITNMVIDKLKGKTNNAN